MPATMTAAIAILLTVGSPVAFAVDDAPAWQEAERNILANHVQLTFPDRFDRAGEAYFSHDDTKIIFQAVETPSEGEAPDEYYAMFVADLVRDADDRITGIENIERISPPGSANTCGWFHPNDSNIVIFGSTVDSPQASAPPGYQRGEGRYRWMFPPGMNIYMVRLDEADGKADSMLELIGDDEAYIAECAISPDGRHLVYCSLESGRGDLYIMNLDDHSVVHVVDAPGYDGGPFFSPDGQRICYRSDRTGTNLLQIYVGELAFDDDGRVTGLDREFQLTDNTNVNWAPFWHPDGRHLVYATSEISHRQYEVFIIDADPGNLEDSSGSVRYGLNKRRVTTSTGFDGLPVFNRDGSLMMWTSQRGDGESSQVWVADFIMPLEVQKLPSAGRPGSR